MSLTIADLETQSGYPLDHHDRSGSDATPGDADWDLENYTRVGRIRALPFTEEDLLDMFEGVPSEHE